MSSDSQSSRAILVTGATGKQGGAVIDALLESESGSAYKLIAVTRNVASSKAKSLVSRGVIVIQGDLNDVPAIFSDAKAVLNSSNTDLWGVFSVQTAIGKGASAKLEEAQGKALVDAALSNNVKFFIYSSIDRGGDGSYDNYVPSVTHFVSKYRTEHHLVDNARGKMDWTILRPVAFMENMEPGMGIKIMGTSWRVAVKEKPLQLVSVKDVGRAAARAFLRPQEFAGRQIPLAGDELTLEAASTIFKSKKGTEIPETFQFLVRFLHWMIPEFGAMYRWFYTDGFGVDIAAVKREDPNMLDFGTWMEEEYDQDEKRI
ncbi:nucleoside-diphosphate-sugar epimerase family protein [Colletotrichum phormii]|uniref:Nucleoside-diphosphate-sugar epimerase family protein n=1 Tax=Colletotrichum phormii TaxID=359342 RepID=A0AAI9ZWB5_9PEZI|nr:nucleoside-diphosphate-sugar epimerase family protein [Colletotrichum phormii]KAK1638039.1 nucleoside-diphosphate-sugar epimerase family protein [Colletotrichum phormii]